MLACPGWRIGGVDLPPVGLRERLLGQPVILGEFGVARLEGLDQLGPVLLRVCQCVLIKGRSERSRNDGAVLFADAG